MARGLRQARSGVLGLVMPTTASAFHAGLADALEDAVARQGRVLMQAISRGDPAQEHARVAALLDRQVEGVVLLPSRAPHAALDALVAARVPAVQVGTPAPDRRLDAVRLDEAQAMGAAIAHLVARGHRRVLFVVRYPDLPVTAARIAALRSTKLVCAEVMAFGTDRSRFEAEVPARLEAADPPSALLASNSILAAWAMGALRRAGRHVPDDVALISFDDPDWAEFTDPPLTVLRQPIGAIAAAALRLLTQRWDTPGLPVQQPMLPIELVPRCSA
jgi:LacI family transcriptional regulator